MSRAPGSQALGWQGLASSVRGASHIRQHLPNQDAGGVRLLAFQAGLVLAVADGHGAAPHPRSDRGSRLAIAAAHDVLGQWAPRADAATIDASVAASLTGHILTRWQADVDADLIADPPDAARHPDARPGTLAGRLLYGSTLLATALTATFALYLQVGDGDLLTVGEDGVVRRMLPGQGDGVLNRTDSLCQEDALARFRVRLDTFAAAPPPALVLLSSDGYANSFGSENAFLQVGSDLLGYLHNHGGPWVEERLANWLTDTSASGSGDDITLALAWPSPVLAAPPAPAKPDQWPTAPAPRPPAPARRAFFLRHPVLLGVVVTFLLWLLVMVSPVSGWLTASTVDNPGVSVERSSGAPARDGPASDNAAPR